MGTVEKLLVVPTKFVNGEEQTENSRDELYTSKGDRSRI